MFFFLLWWRFCISDQNRLSNFGRGTYENYLCEIFLSLGQQLGRRYHFVVVVCCCFFFDYSAMASPRESFDVGKCYQYCIFNATAPVGRSQGCSSTGY